MLNLLWELFVVHTDKKKRFVTVVDMIGSQVANVSIVDKASEFKTAEYSQKKEQYYSKASINNKAKKQWKQNKHYYHLKNKKISEKRKQNIKLKKLHKKKMLARIMRNIKILEQKSKKVSARSLVGIMALYKTVFKLAKNKKIVGKIKNRGGKSRNNYYQHNKGGKPWNNNNYQKNRGKSRNNYYQHNKGDKQWNNNSYQKNRGKSRNNYYQYNKGGKPWNNNSYQKNRGKSRNNYYQHNKRDKQWNNNSYQKNRDKSRNNYYQHNKGDKQWNNNSYQKNRWGKPRNNYYQHNKGGKPWNNINYQKNKRKRGLWKKLPAVKKIILLPKKKSSLKAACNYFNYLKKENSIYVPFFNKKITGFNFWVGKRRLKKERFARAIKKARLKKNRFVRKIKQLRLKKFFVKKLRKSINVRFIKKNKKKSNNPRLLLKRIQRLRYKYELRRVRRFKRKVATVQSFKYKKIFQYYKRSKPFLKRLKFFKADFTRRRKKKKPLPFFVRNKRWAVKGKRHIPRFIKFKLKFKLKKKVLKRLQPKGRYFFLLQQLQRYRLLLTPFLTLHAKLTANWQYYLPLFNDSLKTRNSSIAFSFKNNYTSYGARGQFSQKYWLTRYLSPIKSQVSSSATRKNNFVLINFLQQAHTYSNPILPASAGIHRPALNFLISNNLEIELVSRFIGGWHVVQPHILQLSVIIEQSVLQEWIGLFKETTQYFKYGFLDSVGWHASTYWQMPSHGIFMMKNFMPFQSNALFYKRRMKYSRVLKKIKRFKKRYKAPLSNLILELKFTKTASYLPGVRHFFKGVLKKNKKLSRLKKQFKKNKRILQKKVLSYTAKKKLKNYKRRIKTLPIKQQLSFFQLGKVRLLSQNSFLPLAFHVSFLSAEYVGLSMWADYGLLKQAFKFCLKNPVVSTVKVYKKIKAKKVSYSKRKFSFTRYDRRHLHLTKKFYWVIFNNNNEQTAILNSTKGFLMARWWKRKNEQSPLAFLFFDRAGIQQIYTFFKFIVLPGTTLLTVLFKQYVRNISLSCTHSYTLRILQQTLVVYQHLISQSYQLYTKLRRPICFIKNRPLYGLISKQAKLYKQKITKKEILKGNRTYFFETISFKVAVPFKKNKLTVTSFKQNLTRWIFKKAFFSVLQPASTGSFLLFFARRHLYTAQLFWKFLCFSTVHSLVKNCINKTTYVKIKNVLIKKNLHLIFNYLKMLKNTKKFLIIRKYKKATKADSITKLFARFQKKIGQNAHRKLSFAFNFLTFRSFRHKEVHKELPNNVRTMRGVFLVKILLNKLLKWLYYQPKMSLIWGTRAAAKLFEISRLPHNFIYTKHFKFGISV